MTYHGLLWPSIWNGKKIIAIIYKNRSSPSHLDSLEVSPRMELYINVWYNYIVLYYCVKHYKYLLKPQVTPSATRHKSSKIHRPKSLTTPSCWLKPCHQYFWAIEFIHISLNQIFWPSSLNKTRPYKHR